MNTPDEAARSRIRIAVFSGPTATVQNSEPLVTGAKAREKYGLVPLRHRDGSPPRFDALRPQRLAAAVKVYIEQFSAHPLERDSAHLYGSPDGYLDPNGVFRSERSSPEDKPVYEVTLRPEDGLYLLPYMARQANGEPWEDTTAFPLAPPAKSRQTFYPDASRIFEEIDRFGLDENGLANMLSSKADFDFYRAAPSGGYQKGLPAALRTDAGEGDIPPEKWGEDFWPYRPVHLRGEPPRARLAQVTNMVQTALGGGRYAGAIWLEGSPSVEESIYWLNLLIDTTVPICGNSSQRPHGALANDGDRNIVDSVDYIVSGIWKGSDGRDSVGAVAVLDELVFHSREVQKADARPGGYVATGGHGGIVGTIGQPGPPALTFRPARRHTHCSALRLPVLPRAVCGVARSGGRIVATEVPVKDANGELLAAAIPHVSICKTARYLPEDASGDAAAEVDILACIGRNLEATPLAGFVGEGAAPFGGMTRSVDAALERAVFSGMPVVKVGRGNAEGMVPVNPGSVFIAGSNLTATKARLLLMACLLKLGTLPPAADPANPGVAEREAVRQKVALYQALFDTH
ncbi:MAG: asparaginase [Burkholderiales bacterium]|nr:asparaginase [Burkholderiales bacterium]